jgi:FtsP/CotA-like multicopper oxidase with cupredoxin domain
MQGKKYLLRIINISVDTTYIFSVDNHNLTVITTDFVAIKPYTVGHIAVGIGMLKMISTAWSKYLTAVPGQRYHVAINANPIDNGKLSPNGNYRIRVIPADSCQGFETGNNPDERQGILRYNASNTGVPTSFRRDFSNACSDEMYDRLEPVLPWNVPPFQLSSKFPKFEVGKMSGPQRPIIS